jgi:glycosyltransferase involved in cell wall biosynthesis
VGVIKPTIESILAQTDGDFEIVVCNDSLDDHQQMAEALRSFADPRIRFLPNEKNLGYPLNMRKCIKEARSDVVFLMGQDDIILGRDVFERCNAILRERPDIGAITRPYYWFGEEDHLRPNRVTGVGCDRTVISIHDEDRYLNHYLETVSQLSGLVMRKSLITHDVHEHVFTAHVYPIMSIFKTHKIYFWPTFMIAVRTSSSQTRFLSTIYRPAPTGTWMQLFDTVYPEPQFANMRRVGREFFGTNYLGLVQIKNYGYYRDLFADVAALVRARPKNLLHPLFWGAVAGTALIPRFALRRMVDGYKSLVNRRRFRGLAASARMPDGSKA